MFCSLENVFAKTVKYSNSWIIVYNWDQTTFFIYKITYEQYFNAFKHFLKLFKNSDYLSEEMIVLQKFAHYTSGYKSSPYIMTKSGIK